MKKIIALLGLFSLTFGIANSVNAAEGGAYEKGQVLLEQDFNTDGTITNDNKANYGMSNVNNGGTVKAENGYVSFTGNKIEFKNNVYTNQGGNAYIKLNFKLSDNDVSKKLLKFTFYETKGIDILKRNDAGSWYYNLSKGDKYVGEVNGWSNNASELLAKIENKEEVTLTSIFKSDSDSGMLYTYINDELLYQAKLLSGNDAFDYTDGKLGRFLVEQRKDANQILINDVEIGEYNPITDATYELTGSEVSTLNNNIVDTKVNEVFKIVPTYIGENPNNPATINGYNYNYVNANDREFYNIKTEGIEVFKDTANAQVSVSSNDILTSLAPETFTLNIKALVEDIYATDIDLIYDNMQDIILGVGQTIDLNNYLEVKPAAATNKEFNITSKSNEFVAVNGTKLTGKKASDIKIAIESNDGKVKKEIVIKIVDNYENLNNFGEPKSSIEVNTKFGSYTSKVFNGKTYTPIETSKDANFGNILTVSGYAYAEQFFDISNFNKNKNYKLTGFYKVNSAKSGKLALQINGYKGTTLKPNYPSEFQIKNDIVLKDGSANEWVYFETDEFNCDEVLNGIKIQLGSYATTDLKISLASLNFVETNTTPELKSWALSVSGRKLGNGSVVSLAINSELKIDGIFVPTAAKKDLIIESNNEEIVEVLENGIVKAKDKVGSADISVSINNNGNLETIIFKINTGILVDNITTESETKIELNQDYIELPIILNPVDTTSKIKVVVSNPNIVKAQFVDGTLTIVRLSEGSAVVTLVSEDNAEIKLDIEVKVLKFTDIQVEKSEITLSTGDNYKIEVLNLPEGAMPTFISNDENIVKVDSLGNIEIIGVGTTTISITYDNKTIELYITIIKTTDNQGTPEIPSEPETPEEPEVPQEPANPQDNKVAIIIIAVVGAVVVLGMVVGTVLYLKKLKKDDE